MISDSSDEDEDPILLRDLRIKRAMGDKLVVRSTFFTSIEFKETILECSLNHFNVVQNEWEKESYNEKEYAANLNILRCYDDALSDDVMREEPHTWSMSFYRLGSC
ncbi:unnamed protein product [Arabidopsis thaliana]|uniref:(thale cress) hypothetical protein n=1 Tax=Arabidopsis thaliana TaxID=3702 RepID=A0A7G2ESI7_ARATH|nr:unnamed protein product [Arabidopsis thaliana]